MYIHKLANNCVEHMLTNVGRIGTCVDSWRQSHDNLLAPTHKQKNMTTVMPHPNTIITPPPFLYSNFLHDELNLL